MLAGWVGKLRKERVLARAKRLRLSGMERMERSRLARQVESRGGLCLLVVCSSGAAAVEARRLRRFAEALSDGRMPAGEMSDLRSKLIRSSWEMWESVRCQRLLCLWAKGVERSTDLILRQACEMSLAGSGLERVEMLSLLLSQNRCSGLG